MKALGGIVLIVVGIVFGLYVGVWLLFIGGIVQVIEQIRAETLDALSVAIGVARVVFSGLGFWISGAVLIVPGVALLKDDY